MPSRMRYLLLGEVTNYHRPTTRATAITPPATIFLGVRPPRWDFEARTVSSPTRVAGLLRGPPESPGAGRHRSTPPDSANDLLFYLSPSNEMITEMPSESRPVF